MSKIALKKSNTNFRLEYSVRKNRTTFSDVPLLPEIFRWNDPKGVFHLLSNRFSGNSFSMVNNLGVEKNGVIWKDNNRERDTFFFFFLRDTA